MWPLPWLPVTVETVYVCALIVCACYNLTWAPTVLQGEDPFVFCHMWSDWHVILFGKHITHSLHMQFNIIHSTSACGRTERSFFVLCVFIFGFAHFCHTVIWWYCEKYSYSSWYWFQPYRPLRAHAFNAVRGCVKGQDAGQMWISGQSALLVESCSVALRIKWLLTHFLYSV